MTHSEPLLPIALVLAGSVLACVSAQAAPSCGAVTPLERRIVDRANGDVGALRTFSRLTGIVHGVNMVDVRDNIEQWRAAVECQKVAAAKQSDEAVVAAAGDASPVVAQR